MPSSFGQYQSGIDASTGNLVSASGQMAAQTANTLNNLGTNIAQGIEKYREQTAKNEMVDQEIEGLGSAIQNYFDQIGSDPELVKVASGMIPHINALSTAGGKSYAQKLQIANAAKAKMNGIGEELKLQDYLNTKRLNRDLQNAPIDSTETIVDPVIQNPNLIYQLDGSVGSNKKMAIDYRNAIIAEYGDKVKLKPEKEFVDDFLSDAYTRIETHVKNPQLKAFHLENIQQARYYDYLKTRQENGEELDDSDLIALKKGDTFTEALFNFNTPVATGTAPSTGTAPATAGATTTALPTPAGTVPNATAPTANATAGATTAPVETLPAVNPSVAPTTATPNLPAPASAKVAQTPVPSLPLPASAKVAPQQASATAPKAPIVEKPTERQLANANLAVEKYNKRLKDNVKVQEFANTEDSGQKVDLAVYSKSAVTHNFLAHYGINFEQFQKVNPAFVDYYNVRVNENGNLDPNGKRIASIDSIKLQGLNSDKFMVNLPVVRTGENGESIIIKEKPIASFDELPEPVKARFEQQNGKGSVQKIINYLKSGSQNQEEDQFKNQRIQNGEAPSRPVSTLPPIEQSVNPMRSSKMAMAVPVLPFVGAPAPVKAEETTPANLPPPAKKTGVLDKASIDYQNSTEAKMKPHYYAKAAQENIDKLKMIRDEFNSGNFEAANQLNFFRMGDVATRMNPETANIISGAEWLAIDLLGSKGVGKISGKLTARGINKNVVAETEKIYKNGVEEVLKLKDKIKQGKLTPEQQKSTMDAIKKITEKVAGETEKRAKDFYGSGNSFMRDFSEVGAAFGTWAALQVADQVFPDRFGKYGRPAMASYDPIREKAIKDEMQKAYEGISSAGIDTIGNKEALGGFIPEGFFYGGEPPTAEQLNILKTSLDTSISNLEKIRDKNQSEFQGMIGKTIPVVSKGATAQTTTPVELETLPVSSRGDAINMGTITYERPKTSEKMKEATKNYIKSLHGFVPAGFEAGYKALHPEDDLKFSETPYGTMMWTGGKWEMLKTGNVRTLSQQAEDNAVTFGQQDGRGGLIPTELVSGSGIKLAGIFSGTVSDASKFRREYQKLIKAQGLIKKLAAINDKFGESWNTSLRGTADVMVNQLISQLRIEMIGVGTVSNYEQTILDKIIANPTEFFNFESTTRAKYDQIAAGIEDALKSVPEVYGLQVTKSGRDLEYEKKIRDRNLKASQTLANQ